MVDKIGNFAMVGVSWRNLLVLSVVLMLHEERNVSIICVLGICHQVKEVHLCYFFYNFVSHPGATYRREM